VKLTQKLNAEETKRLFNATRQTLAEWVQRSRGVPVSTASGSPRVPDSTISFPEKVTAFRAEMSVHGKYGQPCPRCGHKIQRIRYASNETNYCPNCQTGGKLLADRALSRLLRGDWPKSVEELEGLTPR
jgi:formamidopyrimidine-DNA glycosylase